LHGLRLLLVDDDRLSLAVLCAMLESAGARVQCVGRGADAVARIAEERYDLLLCDIYMPELDGFEVMRRVRQMGAASGGDVPAAAITAHPSFENRRDALRAGFQDVVGKPVEIATLVDLVLRLTGGAHRA
jgi:CheY-like chemotaxis protein